MGADYRLSTDPADVDRVLVHRWLSEDSYWAAGRAFDNVSRSIDGSRPYSILSATGQVAFARAVTDGATFAWICDVYVDRPHRGRGLGVRLVDAIVADLTAAGIDRFLLGTRDAHEVYRRSGFEPVAAPQRFMEIDRRPTRAAILAHLDEH
ncbi:GNAT family N-acetyltransferase [Dactylosporangium vinaceum]|uniref:GNAT family N-acetyltransferase n=1 Tax=Dactylosporangium vinaceum TaxID=53362 RepID=A0ABV5MM68_9ACTN|nr:GNAT family N-acetyltransferase [Dactylosporangium vinaceum]UAC02062.1 GNAT family N-acetyltransferase [Dactylosporangium vinaceum]